MPDCTDNTEQWFALTIAPQHELTVAGRLSAKGFDSSVPTYRVRRRWSDRTKVITLPLFPGYVLCRFDPGRRVPVMNTPGVRGAVCFGGKLAALDQADVARVQRMAASGLPLDPLEGLRTGTRVKILAGPLCGMEGIFTQSNGGTRVVVNLDILNRSVAVQVDADAVTPSISYPASIPGLKLHAPLP